MSPVLVPDTKPIVLVVDDVAGNRELVEAQLADLGDAVRQARDGLEALEQIAAEEPDLVLLDGARIVAVSDAWDAMTSARPYRAGLGREEALRRLREGSGSQWDAVFVDLFLALLDDGLAERVASEQLSVTDDQVT